MDTVHSSLQYQLWPVLRCNGKSACNTVLGHNFLHKIIFTWYWVQLFCRQWIHLIEFEGSKMSCILFCISIQMLNCSTVRGAIALQTMVSPAKVRHSSHSDFACIVFCFFAAFCLLYFHILRPRWGWGGWHWRSIIWFKKNTRGCWIFERDTFQKRN